MSNLGLDGLFNSLAGLGGAFGSQAAVHCARCGCTHDGFHSAVGKCFATNSSTVWQPNQAEVAVNEAREKQVQEMQIAVGKSQCRMKVLAAFDWSLASNLQYLDRFFSQWGWEPLELPQEAA